MIPIDVQSYWSAELGESVEIIEYGGFGVFVGGQACYTAESLEKIERWLGVYHVLKGDN